MKTRSKLTEISSRLYLVFLMFLVLIPAGTAAFWIFYNVIPQTLVSASTGLPGDFPVPQTLDGFQRFLGFLIFLLPLSAEMFAIVTIMRLLKLYREGIIFSATHVLLFKRLGQALICYGIAGIFQTTGLGLVMTMNNPPGQRMLTLGMWSDDISLFVVAAVVLMLSWVMDEGRKQAEEQALTV